MDRRAGTFDPLTRAHNRQRGRLSDEEMALVKAYRDQLELEAAAAANAARSPTIWRYRRVSHPDQVQTGIGLEDQTRQVDSWVQLILSQHPDIPYVVADWLEDAAVSAWKHPLFSRPAGKEIWREMRRGDQVVFHKFDRTFRNVKDALHSLELMDKRGVTAHFVDLKIDRSTAMGRCMFTIIAAVAELESGVKSERNKAAVAILKARGAFPGQEIPYGYRRVGEKGSRRNVPLSSKNLRKFRQVPQQIIRLRDSNPKVWTWIAISSYIKSKCRQAGDPNWQEWREKKCQWEYRREKLFAIGIRAVNAHVLDASGGNALLSHIRLTESGQYVVPPDVASALRRIAGIESADPQTAGPSSTDQIPQAIPSPTERMEQEDRPPAALAD